MPAVTILEVRGGTDKGPDGHRRDSGPLADAFRKRGWNASIEFYSDADRKDMLRKIAASSDAYISRVNPGQYDNYTEALYFDMCRQLARCGAFGLVTAAWRATRILTMCRMLSGPLCPEAA